MKQQRGFTIIEAVVAITIAGLLLAAALPSAGAWIRNSRIRTAAESISNGLMQARNEAVRRNQSVSFFLVSDADPVSMTDACALSANSSGWVIRYQPSSLTRILTAGLPAKEDCNILSKSDGSSSLPFFSLKSFSRSCLFIVCSFSFPKAFELCIPFLSNFPLNSSTLQKSRYSSSSLFPNLLRRAED